MICLQPEHLRRGQPMAAVRRPEAALLAAHDDHRIEERAGLVDLLRQSLRVRRRQVALERRRLHGAQRQRGEQQRSRRRADRDRRRSPRHRPYRPARPACSTPDARAAAQSRRSPARAHCLPSSVACGSRTGRAPDPTWPSRAPLTWPLYCAPPSATSHRRNPQQCVRSRVGAQSAPRVRRPSCRCVG